MTDLLWLQEQFARSREHRSHPNREAIQCRTWWEAAGALWAAAFLNGWF